MTELHQFDLHRFDDATTLTELDEGVYQGRTTTPYANMAGPFGGITSACLMRAVLSDPRVMGTPVSMTVNLCGAVANGVFDITTTVKRQGKYIQHWSVELKQDGAVRSTASLIFAHRNQGFDHQPEKMPSVPPPDQIAPFDGHRPLPWLKAYEFRFVTGAPDFSGPSDTALLPSKSIQYIADDPPRPLDYLSLTAMADSYLLRIFKIRPKFLPMGTVSITTHFIGTPDEIATQGADPVLGIVDGSRFHGNFHDQNMQIWGKDGTLLASGNQLVWFKE